VRSGFEERADLFSTVAFWYQQGIAEGLPEVPYGPARLPHGNARQIEVERSIGEVKTEGGEAGVQKEVFWSRDLLFFKAKGPGSKMHVPFDVQEDGNYELLAQIAHAPDYGSYDVLLDGQPIVSDVRLEHEPGANLGLPGPIDAYHLEIYVAEDHLLGWKRLARGRHELTFACAGKNTLSAGYNLGIDTLILARLGKVEMAGGQRAEQMRQARGAAALRPGLKDPDAYVREAAAWALTQDARAAAECAAQLGAGLEDSDAVVRGLAALALVQCGGCARGVLSGLTVALKDADQNVRMMSAEAIASLGAAAAPAVAALTEAAGREGEHPHVQRSLAKALGAIGPAAAPAIPALEKLQRVPRVRTSAEAALRSIRR
jgi:hypothetical protein